MDTRNKRPTRAEDGRRRPDGRRGGRRGRGRRSALRTGRVSHGAGTAARAAGPAMSRNALTRVLSDGPRACWGVTREGCKCPTTLLCAWTRYNIVRLLRLKIVFKTRGVAAV